MLENNFHCYEFDGFRLDITNFQLTENGEVISLTQKSFELLLFLVENHGRILKKEELLEELWEGNFVEEANLTQHIYMLRKALKQKERKKVYIETIPKNGYRFLAEVQEMNLENIHKYPKDEISGQKEPIHRFQDEYKSEYLRDAVLDTNNFDLNYIKESQTSSKNHYYSNKYFAALTIISFCLVTFIGYYYYSIKNTDLVATDNMKSFAVLPFKQIEGKKDEKLGVGVADVLIARLANIEGISVMPTASILRFANSDNSDLSRLGKNLEVEFIIVGTIQRDRDYIRVTTQLYSVRDKRQIWTETFDEQYSDIFSLQDKISEKVTRKNMMGLDIQKSVLTHPRK